MTELEYSGTRQQLRDEVRFFLGGVSEKFLKDGVIDTQVDRIVIPFLERGVTNPDNYDQNQIDNAIVAYAADRSYNAIPLKSTVSGGGLTTNYATKQYRTEIRQRTSEALAALDLVPPAKGPAPIASRTDGFLR